MRIVNSQPTLHLSTGQSMYSAQRHKVSSNWYKGGRESHNLIVVQVFGAQRVSVQEELFKVILEIAGSLQQHLQLLSTQIGSRRSLSTKNMTQQASLKLISTIWEELSKSLSMIEFLTG